MKEARPRKLSAEAELEAWYLPPVLVVLTDHRIGVQRFTGLGSGIDLELQLPPLSLF